MSVSLPAWFTQSVETVAASTQLKPFFLQPQFQDVDLITAINDQLPLSASFVDEKLAAAAKPYPWPFSDEQLATALPNYSAPQRAAKTANQINIAIEATRLLVASALWKLAVPTREGRDSPTARAAADGRDQTTSGIARIGSAESLLNSLCESIAEISSDIKKATGKSNGRGYILTGRGDYSSCSLPDGN